MSTQVVSMIRIKLIFMNLIKREILIKLLNI